MRRIITANNKYLEEELAKIGIDPAACRIFKQKAESFLVKIDDLSCAQANVLKQLALTCGADLAIPKDAYFGSRRKRFGALLFANKRNVDKLIQRLNEQSWLSHLSSELRALSQQKNKPVWQIKEKKIVIDRTLIMGVINVNQDSFYTGNRYTNEKVIIRAAKEMEQAGADIIDIGAESSRPGAEPVDEKEEIRRLKKILPVVTRRSRVPVSIDTYKASVAKFAIENGALIINDISGMRFDPKMGTLISKNGVGIVIMHMQRKPKTMQKKPKYNDLMAEIFYFFKQRIEQATAHGIDRENIVIDPGLGFGKTLNDNYQLIERLGELKTLNRPLLVGHSRKSFIGVPFNLSPDERLEGSLGLSALLIKNGANILRVHDVGETKKVTRLIDRILE
ncbi:dihydropteroate synthase [candidate division WOR-3 bacterium RBG_13_43_14]|uniref:dihydropteroate synthase n=1 Tax=candidate division WOR-3 bacterium RBG_13_43_14 TaxID=1802590 RepID=A0A1F4U9Q7_UNCW3|nr:MAG: dihydropteroate synthase [candidate division WOR-3 bacterium RBG_13_43_14]